MNLKISQSIEKSQQFEIPEICMLQQLIPRELVQEVLKKNGKVEQRKRKLPSEWVIWLVIVMAWLPRHCMQAVLGNLWRGISLGWSHPTVGMATASAITQARYRLGVKSLENLFKTFCCPMATSETKGAFYQGMRLVAFDGTCETVADSKENASYFGYHKNQYGTGAYPQLRAVYACELGTHLIFDAVLDRYYRSEQSMSKRLLRSLEEDMLLLVDAGLSSFDLISGAVARGTDVLVRSHASRKWIVFKQLQDGSFLAWMSSSPASRTPDATPILVRVIRYTIDDENRPHHGETQTLVTTLLDPELYPILELIVLYHDRWDIEIAIDEMDTHQRLANRPFRSLKPVGVIQEFYAFLIAYFLIRLIMLRTADHAQLDPDRLSFVNSVHIILDALPLFQLVHETDHHLLWTWIEHWLLYFQLPPRRNRSNPRVIKRQLSKFPRKQTDHLNSSQPDKPFSDAIVILT